MEHTDHSAPLAQEIQKSYKSLSDLVSRVPDEKRNLQCLEGTGGQVSVSDIIAYQIGWGKLLIGWYESGVQGKDANMPGEGFTKWDYTGIAKHFYQKYHADGASKQMALFQETVERILSIIETEYKSGQLDKLGVWAWCTLKSAEQWPLSKWIRVNTVAPYKRAYTLIRKLP